MFCVQCGFKIEDGYKFCPNCGAKVVSVQDDTQQKHEIPRGELDKIADDIFWVAPVDIVGCAKRLSKETGIPFSNARLMMKSRYASWKQGKKSGKYPDTEFCPNCASQDIQSYEEPGITVIQPVKVLGGGYISSSAPSSTWMRCQRCGCKWKPKKKK